MSKNESSKPVLRQESKGVWVKACVCGGVTVSLTPGNRSISMSHKTFREKFPGVILQRDRWGNCNYCTNHWGYELCGCGSGEPFQKCHPTRYGRYYSRELMREIVDEVENRLNS